MDKNIAVIRGDGIGPEIVDSAVRVLEAIAKKYNHKFEFTPYLIGGNMHYDRNIGYRGRCRGGRLLCADGWICGRVLPRE